MEGVVAPADTPPSVIDNWNAVFVASIANASVQWCLLDLGMTNAQPNRSAQFAAFIQQELERWQQFGKIAPMRAKRPPALL